jgi:adenylate cyclase
VAGRVHVSESTRRLLGEPFLLEERGALEVEGKGEVKTWFVGGRNNTEGGHQSWRHEQTAS